MAEEYTPTERELVEAWAWRTRWRRKAAATEARRAIARIKAEALREVAARVTEVDGRRDDAAADWLRAQADQIEKEAT